ncbi:DUF692 domain-containing protein [Pseudenhygromyxa sp. WMMC2535]|uniref:DUF692 domain-containing protein n=1 Tax=Pseudenhygromyxa sp. WMMC2535 TaxID=2712867 RepID=UPI001556F3F0|nr:DUF692 domain-containing protein [Pseudenhygromyxa sp. WMMC2535]NVB38735.1 DUF692 domain-containing protein [Pseudenhygromyxa sp. WMMC2535]
MTSVRERFHSSKTPTGVGLGLRAEFIADVSERLDEVVDKLAFLEVCPENYMRRGGRSRRLFETIAERVPLITHGVMMSLGALDPFDAEYFAELREFLPRYGSGWHSDHLCFSGYGGAVLHDLLPLPLDEASALRFAARVREAQDRLGVQLAVENVSYYLPMGQPRLSEAEFATIICEEADCGLLLDVNNVYVNSKNFGFDAREMVAAYPLDRVIQMHVAGHSRWDRFGFFLDDHGAAAEPTVHELMQWVVERTGPLPVLLERDKKIPALDELLDEVAALQASYDAALARRESQVQSRAGAGAREVQRAR